LRVRTCAGGGGKRLYFVIPAHAEIHRFSRHSRESGNPAREIERRSHWIPACAGMTSSRERGMTSSWERGDDEPTRAGMTSQNDLAVRSKNLILLNAH
jgi:hypothetical protein